MALLETTILQSIDYRKSLPLHDRGEYTKTLAEFNNTFQNHCIKHIAISTTFIDPICFKKICFIKGKWRRGLTNHEAVQAQEADGRRYQQVKSIALARTQKHATMKEKNCKLEGSLSDKNRLYEAAERDLLIENLDDEEDLLYLGTQPRPIRNKDMKDQQTRNFFDHVS